MRIELADFGAWAAERLLAEYDPEGDVVRVSAHAYARVHAKLGAEPARDFVRYALEHERFHRANPAASEAEAHAFAVRESGVEAGFFEAAVRGSGR